MIRVPGSAFRVGATPVSVAAGLTQGLPADGIAVAGAWYGNTLQFYLQSYIYTHGDSAQGRATAGPESVVSFFSFTNQFDLVHKGLVRNRFPTFQMLCHLDSQGRETAVV